VEDVRLVEDDRLVGVGSDAKEAALTIKEAELTIH